MLLPGAAITLARSAGLASAGSQLEKLLGMFVAGSIDVTAMTEGQLAGK